MVTTDDRQLGQSQVDILFLDINMPGLTGISMARTLKNAPLIIFTTAYPQFAVETESILFIEGQGDYIRLHMD